MKVNSYDESKKERDAESTPVTADNYSQDDYIPPSLQHDSTELTMDDEEIGMDQDDQERWKWWLTPGSKRSHSIQPFSQSVARS